MKPAFASTGLLLLASHSATAFTIAPHTTSSSAVSSARSLSKPLASSTQLSMFGGAGAGAPTEDNPEEEDKMKQAASALGMPLEEYKMALKAQAKLASDMDSTMVQGGSADSVLVDRDINNPAKTLKVTISEAAKAKGKESLSKELVAALGKAKEDASKGRQQARTDMMKLIQSGGFS